MRVDIDGDVEKKFEPFSFTVRVETPQEARLWFHIFNKRSLSAAIFDSSYIGRTYNRDMMETLEPNKEMREFIRGRIDIDA